MASSFRSERHFAWWLAGALALASPAAGADEAPLEAVGAGGARVVLELADERALIVHFWASWCPECVDELPTLEAEAARCAASVRIAAVNVGESHTTAEDFRARHGLRLPLLRDPDGKLWRRFARGLPANVIWTRDERHATTGPLGAAEWRERMTALGCDETSR